MAPPPPSRPPHHLLTHPRPSARRESAKPWPPSATRPSPSTCSMKCTIGHHDYRHLPLCAKPVGHCRPRSSGTIASPCAGAPLRRCCRKSHVSQQESL
ncbi:unnamed protein product [Urochloa humidicola]